jgi:hypothetical protein
MSQGVGDKSKIGAEGWPAQGLSGLNRSALLGLLVFALGACQSPAAIQGAAKAPGAPEAGIPSDNPRSAPPRSVFATTIIGLPRARIEEVFGKPRQVRREAPAEVWQYAGENCVLDVYLYKVEGGDFSVSFIEARDGAAVATEPEACFSTLTQRASL